MFSFSAYNYTLFGILDMYTRLSALGKPKITKFVPRYDRMTFDEICRYRNLYGCRHIYLVLHADGIVLCEKIWKKSGKL